MSRPLRVLHITISLGATSPEYNEHFLPLAQERELAICSYMKATIVPPPQIRLFEGDGTVGGFTRALRQALESLDYDVIHVHQQQVGALLLLVRLTRWNSMKDIVCTVHNSFQNFRLRNRVLLIPVVALFPRVVLCSKSAYESMPRFLRWLGGRRITVVQNGADTARVNRALESSLGGPRVDQFRVVCVGRLISRKNPDTLLEAFSRIGDSLSTLVFVGDGDLRQQLLGEAHRLGLGQNVVITGLVERDDVYRHVAQADVGVAVSRGEGLPIAVLEMMACGRPVILSDIPPHREIAAGVEFVPLIPPDDAAGLAGELRRFNEMSTQQRAAIGDSCRRLVEDKFSLQEMHRRYERVYRDVIGRPRLRNDKGRTDELQRTQLRSCERGRDHRGRK